MRAIFRRCLSLWSLPVMGLGVIALAFVFFLCDFLMSPPPPEGTRSSTAAPEPMVFICALMAPKLAMEASGWDRSELAVSAGEARSASFRVMIAQAIGVGGTLIAWGAIARGLACLLARGLRRLAKPGSAWTRRAVTQALGIVVAAALFVGVGRLARHAMSYDGAQRDAPESTNARVEPIAALGP